MRVCQSGLAVRRTDGHRCCGIAQCVCTEGCCAAPCPLPCLPYLPGCPCPLWPGRWRGTGPEHLTVGHPRGAGGPHAMRGERPQALRGSASPGLASPLFFFLSNVKFFWCVPPPLPSTPHPAPVTPHPPHPLSQPQNLSSEAPAPDSDEGSLASFAPQLGRQAEGRQRAGRGSLPAMANAAPGCCKAAGCSMAALEGDGGVGCEPALVLVPFPGAPPIWLNCCRQHQSMHYL